MLWSCVCLSVWTHVYVRAYMLPLGFGFFLVVSNFFNTGLFIRFARHKPLFATLLEKEKLMFEKQKIVHIMIDLKRPIILSKERNLRKG